MWSRKVDEKFLVIGLGNPGRQYLRSRHNVGFMLVDRLAGEMTTRFSRLHANALISQGCIGSSKVILAKPQTFMNLSGRAVRGLVRFHKLPLENIIIAHDDLDIPLGVLRIRPDGGSGGQKGLSSILEYLGTDKFPRLRIGIGRPPGHMKAPDFVLDDFSDGEFVEINDVLERGVLAVKEWILNGLDACMNKYNGKNPDL
jgi:PTH1 family peptidyl-tRNA hydrolase